MSTPSETNPLLNLPYKDLCAALADPGIPRELTDIGIISISSGGVNLFDQPLSDEAVKDIVKLHQEAMVGYQDAISIIDRDA